MVFERAVSRKHQPVPGKIVGLLSTHAPFVKDVCLLEKLQDFNIFPTNTVFITRSCTSSTYIRILGKIMKGLFLINGLTSKQYRNFPTDLIISII